MQHLQLNRNIFNLLMNGFGAAAVFQVPEEEFFFFVQSNSISSFAGAWVYFLFTFFITRLWIILLNPEKQTT